MRRLPAHGRTLAMMNRELRETLASLCHEQWSGWMRYLFDKCTKPIGRKPGTVPLLIPSWAVNRWDRQMETSYANLSEEEKESDRKEADKFLQHFESALAGESAALEEMARLQHMLDRERADNALHVYGRCTCHGEGTCLWCERAALAMAAPELEKEVARLRELLRRADKEWCVGYYFEELQLARDIKAALGED